ncbi:MAG: FAD-linked oxidase C-terminal domain-containing protein [Actinomycetota bacterium]|nr:FAD-linked oxidase C-terminal domain-containing protein [Actinomycetota bacterium]
MAANSQLLLELEARLDPECIQSDVDVIAAYAQDRAVFEGAGSAAVLVMPRSTAEVLATVEAATSAGVPIVPRGAGTGLTGAANATDGCVLLSLHRMNQILEIDVINRMCRVQPGVINSDLKDAVAKHDLFYPPDPASFEMSSVGGNVATNAGGLCCVKYGVTRDYVVGLEVVLASGAVIRTGRRTLKSTTGLDLTGLFVGSEGVLGVITEITLKLVPAPPPPATAVAYFDQLPHAGETIVEVFKRGYEPSMMEILDRASLRQVDAVYNMGLDVEAACLLLIQTSGDHASASIEAIASICRATGATYVAHVDDPAEGEMLVEVRRRVWPAFERLGKAMLPEDVAVPRQHLPELMAGIVAIGERHELELPTIGHAGDGNMHPLLIFNGEDENEVDRVKTAFAEIVKLALSLGGTIAAEHGVGTLKRAFVSEEIGPTELGAMEAIRAALDPDRRFNPGKKL